MDLVGVLATLHDDTEPVAEPAGVALDDAAGTNSGSMPARRRDCRVACACTVVDTGQDGSVLETATRRAPWPENRPADLVDFAGIAAAGQPALGPV